MEKRFFIDQNLIENNTITLTEDEHVHLSKVLRLRVGEVVECFYDNGPILKCEIELITKNYSTLKVLSQEEVCSNPKVNITLFQGLPKLDKLELISQKLTEIGVGRIIPFSSTFCIAKENLNKIDRIKKIIISACKQCGRTSLTKVENPVKFDDMLKMFDNFDVVIFANETQKNYTLDQALSEVDVNNEVNVAYIVGSEGGFSPAEIERICANKKVKSISLGNRILRTETASIVCAGLAMQILETT